MHEWLEWQCPWCKWIVDIKRERVRKEEAVRKETRHMICNICLAEQYIILKTLQEREEKNKRRRWERVKL